METQISVKFDNKPDHAFFDYVGIDNKLEIYERINRGVSQVVFFLVNGIERFAAIIDFHYGCVHVREVGGHFPFMWKYLREFCEGLAKVVGVNSITFRTYSDGVKYLAKKAGYSLNDKGEFEKVIA